MADITELGAVELLEAFRARRLSPAEALDAFASRIERVDGDLGAFAALCLERARTEAAVAERAYAPDGSARPLEGVPFAAKDIFDTAEVPTGYGSSMFADHLPDADAEAVHRMRMAGAILVGKTRTHEFAWGITSVNAQTGTPRNPRDPARVAGGSSGGSAVALASRQVPIALGTDTGGSIRIPSSFCGTTGIKPTFGSVSRRGVLPLAATLDHPGPMAHQVADLPPLLEVLRGRPLAVADAGLRVGVCPELHRVALADDIQAVFDHAVTAIGQLYGGVVELAFSGAERIHPTFTTIQGAEAVITHRRAGLFPDRADEYGADVRGRLQAAQSITLEDYADATATRQALDRRIGLLFDQVDVIVTPITAVPPPLIADPDVVDHLGERMPLRDCVLPYTVPQDLFGLPTCAVPAGVDALGLPVAVQVWGARGSDSLVLGAASALAASLA
jgi:aspartyl-tRNA(Asn)/glutamyl-tRNA(Gln) amidotransferase subunit A